MKCPFCTSTNTQVLESRTGVECDSIRRRRECLKCHKRFTTLETIKGSTLWVIKRDKSREPFDKLKLRKGILRAVEKRPVSIDKVDEIVDSVEREMLNAEETEIRSDKIGKAVLKRLKKIDKVAWLRFASVYLHFEELRDFEKAIKRYLQ